jgi:hypothetical protein
MIRVHLGRHLTHATSYLLELEQALRAYETDVSALRNFRKATNQVRQTAWLVEQWRAQQSKPNGNGKSRSNGKPNGNGKNHSRGVTTEIHADLLMRALEANLALLDELETNEAAVPPELLGDLLHSIELLQRRLGHLLPRE